MLKKRFTSLFLALAMVLGLSGQAFASGITTQPQVDVPIMGLSEEATELQSENTEFSAYATVTTIDEYEALQAAKAASALELAKKGYSFSEVAALHDGTAEREITEKIFETAQLPEDMLSTMGYSDEKIAILKSLSGNETLEELSVRGALASCDVTNKLVAHTYSTLEDETYFAASYTWKWDQCPAFLKTDCIGIGWNHDFAIDEDALPSTTTIEYVGVLNSAAKKTKTTNMLEKEINTVEYQFNAGPYYNGDQYYAKSGYGTIYLSCVGKVSNVKLQFKYAHSAITAGAPTVSAPWGVSFGFEHATEIYVPTSVVNHGAPTIID